jgi:N4-gp56 family major capsid protein
VATTTTSLNDLLPSIIQEALFVASEQSIMRGLVKNYTLGPAQGKTINVPIYPQQTAVSLTEGVRLTDHTISGYANVSTDTATLTIGEVGIATQISDLARLSSASNVVSDVGRLFGEAIARKIDKDLTAQFINFTTNLVGSANVSKVTGANAISSILSAADIFKAVAKLRSAGVPTNDMACVVHPAVAYDLLANLTNAYTNPNGGDLQNEAMRMGYVGSLAGIPVYQTSNIDNNGTTGDYSGAVFHRNALGFGLMQDIKIEAQRDALLRGDSLVASALYATGVIYEAYGCVVLADSSIL